MQSRLLVAVVLSSASFAWFGLGCFLSRRVMAEFARYGIARLRRPVGALQIAASLALAAGAIDARFRPLLIAAAAGLAAMMCVALLVRRRIRDPWATTLPAIGFLCLNLYIAASA